MGEKSIGQLVSEMRPSHLKAAVAALVSVLGSTVTATYWVTTTFLHPPLLSESNARELAFARAHSTYFQYIAAVAIEGRAPFETFSEQIDELEFKSSRAELIDLASAWYAENKGFLRGGAPDFSAVFSRKITCGSGAVTFGANAHEYFLPKDIKNEVHRRVDPQSASATGC